MRSAYMSHIDRLFASLDRPDTAETICPFIPVPHVMFSKSSQAQSNGREAVRCRLDKRRVSLFHIGKKAFLSPQPTQRGTIIVAETGYFAC